MGRTRRLAGALLLGTTLAGASLPALADNLNVTGITIGGTEALKVDVPSVEVVDGNVDEAAIRALFSTDPSTGLAALATLNAASLTIPKIGLTMVGPGPDGTPQQVVVEMNNLKLENVVNGVAETAMLESVTVPPGPGGFSLTLGNYTITDFDLGGMLGVYGLVQSGSDGTLKPIYTSSTFSGGEFGSPEFKCVIGSGESGAYNGRPLKYTFDDLMKATADLQVAEKAGNPPSAEQITLLARFYADALSAFSYDPQTMSGFNCSGASPDGMTFSVASGPLNMGAYEPGIYPQIALDGLRVDMGDLGFLNLGNFTWKTMDFTSAIDLVNAAPSIDLEWLMVNGRKLIPAFEGLSLADLSLDLPNPEEAGARIAGSLGGLDVTLGSYVNGIPSDIALAINAFEMAMPTSTDGPGPALIAMGIDKLRLTSGTQLHWDEASQTIVVDELSFDSPDLGDITITGVLGNATADLFADNPDQAMAASMGLTIKSLTLDFEDRGLGPILIATGAAQAGQPDQSFRMMMAGSAQGTMLQLFPNSDATIRAVQAIGQYFGGASQLSLSLESVDPAGVPVGAFAAAAESPAALQGLFTIDGSADGEPVATDAPETQQPELTVN